ncbi:MAG: methyltransferase domain-containing protein [Actinomycetota bacterium]|nr:methyltransferase domain-containing protein [Actinomycetota bacterium]
MASEDPNEQRAELLDHWDLASVGWARRAGRVRDSGMPVSVWMVEHLAPAPGERVLELAAGPGDTGFMAAELIGPTGRLVSSDASERMLAIARSRAQAQGIENVEFAALQLEWIDLETASVDAILCRWGVMLSIDPGAALQECRRVLRPGGRLALAVWDAVERNPWATIPNSALVHLGHASPPEPGAPGPFALSAPGRLEEMLAEAGFVETVVEAVAVDRFYDGFEDFLDETLDLSFTFGSVWARLSDSQQSELMRELESRAAPYTAADGSLRLPGSSLVALAQA